MPGGVIRLASPDQTGAGQCRLIRPGYEWDVRRSVGLISAWGFGLHEAD